MPEFAEEILSEKQRLELAEVRKAPMSVEMPSSYQDAAAKREIYTNWFFQGYTFTKATGIKFHHHSLYINVTPERRPMIEGWLAGQVDGEMDRFRALWADMRSALSNSAAQSAVSNQSGFRR